MKTSIFSDAQIVMTWLLKRYKWKPLRCTYKRTKRYKTSCHGPETNYYNYYYYYWNLFRVYFALGTRRLRRRRCLFIVGHRWWNVSLPEPKYIDRTSFAGYIPSASPNSKYLMSSQFRNKVSTKRVTWKISYFWCRAKWI